MSHEVEAIRRYIEIVTASFEREVNTSEAALDQQAKGAPDHLIQSLVEDYAEATSDFLGHFPTFALETTFVATYSLLEDEMFEIARIVGHHLKINLEPEELGDKGIHAAKKYLEKLCGVTVPPDQHWEQAVNHGRIRNVYVHRRSGEEDEPRCPEVRQGHDRNRD